MQMKILIVENEWIIRRDLESLIKENFPDHLVVGNCGTYESAVRLIELNKPDLLLLDINLAPDRTAFDLLDQLPTANPFKIIFLTAYDEFGVKAIKYGATDYLLKPVSIQELKTAFQKVFLAHSGMSGNQATNPNQDEILVLNSQQFTKAVPISEISHCIGNGSYTKFFLKTGENILVSKNIKQFENKLLSGANFIRSHKSCIVNKRTIDYYHKDGYFVLKDRSQIPVSVHRREEILNFYKGQKNENS